MRNIVCCALVLLAFTACSGSKGSTGASGGESTGSTAGSGSHGSSGSTTAGPSSSSGNGAGTNGTVSSSTATTAASTNGASTAASTSSGTAASTSSGGASSSGSSGDGCTTCDQSTPCSGSALCLIPSASSATGYCESPCGANDACPTGFVCAEVEGAAADGGLGYYCDPLPGTCMAVTTPGGTCATCNSTTACPNGDPCFEDSTGGMCIDPCDSSGACLAGFTCESLSGNNYCVPEYGTCAGVGPDAGTDPCAACTSTPTCPGIQACLTAQGASSGVCGPACSPDAGCPTGFTCASLGAGQSFCEPGSGTCP